MPFINVDEATRKYFDYIIVGGGTSGLALATRLSENPKISVLVVEAGQSHFHDPKVDIPSNFGSVLDDPKYVWDFTTAEQPNLNGRVLPMPRGKGLGGSSNVNLFVWCKPPAADIDAIEKLGNPGWNWDDFAKYSKRSEAFNPPSQSMVDAYPGLTFNPEYRGAEGSIQISFPPQSYTVDKMVRQAILQMPDVDVVGDPTGGDITGTWMCSANIDPRKCERVTSATGYLLPHLKRENLSVLTECSASRVLLNDLHVAGDLTASGVEIIYQEQCHFVQGSFVIFPVNSPHILELSGIGNPSILSDIGLDVKVDLPGVGENLQEHTVLITTFELRPDTSAEYFDLFVDPEHRELAEKTYASGAGYRMGVTSQTFVPLAIANPDEFEDIVLRAEQEVEALKDSGSLPLGLCEQYVIQLENLRNPSLPDHQVMTLPGSYPVACPDKRCITMLGGQHHPFSRGSTHATSKNPSHHPRIDPNHISTGIDLELGIQDIKLARKIAATEPLKSAILQEITPGPAFVTDEDLREWAKAELYPMWHTIGTCSMLPREKNGVVDPYLKVYGTSNLYVADLSIIPLHFAAHSQTIAYAIGEKAADILARKEQQ
ncbi:hypothetical protein D9619_009175 [Psilocybe cf. subviscida]|uniref:pyranose dehydrogenase (acceptor) n=1 Tax=Psilocybe cf. subviscida TaxID=2480587 RepID=A0A8H5FAH3_9AGAR|nr:hypothetical protein D9619_009175 [Psilocybe cf. subviscida]